MTPTDPLDSSAASSASEAARPHALPLPGADSARATGLTAAQSRAERRLQMRAALLLIFTAALLLCAGLYLMWVRGAFESTQRLVLMSDDAEGVNVGMDMTFAGFPIGRVSSIDLAPDGRVRIVVDVPVKDAKWLRTSSVFTLERGLVGAARLRAFTGVPEDPLLPADAERDVLRGDVSAEIPRMVADARDVLQNISRMTGSQSELNNAVAQLRRFTQRVNSVKTGLIGALTGDYNDATRASQLLTSSNKLLKQLTDLAANLDATVRKADAQVLGQGGLMQDARASMSELRQLLTSARQSLVKVDAAHGHAEAALKDARAITGNAREASADLGGLRADVESSLQQVDALMTELNRKWPFAPKKQEIQLP